MADTEDIAEARRKLRLLRELKYNKELYDASGKWRAAKQLRDAEEARAAAQQLKQKARSRAKERSSCEEGGALRGSIGCAAKSGR